MKRLSVLLTALAAVAATGLVQADQAEATTEGVHGPVKLVLNSIYAYEANGARIPAKDKDCGQLYKSFMGSVMTAEFSTEPAKSWAKSSWTLKGPGDDPVVFDLHPLGIAGKYEYGNWYRKEFNGKEVYGVTFSAQMGKGIVKPVPPYQSTISFIANDNLTCALMNESPMKTLTLEKQADATDAK
ncbi:hypothetical protein [Dyella subtropica]|uniref:hypothetical protein n=1 Tax=Dyella subtropica TaxID=2992127 RepID=UPI002252FC2C|nr:hypothetical protein [Dyella subtropica]